MGIEIENIEFTLQDFERFSSRLRQELEILRSTLNQPGFGRGAPSLGAELELHLVDADVRPAPRNEALIEQSGDCLLYTSPSPRDATLSRMPSSA